MLGINTQATFSIKAVSPHCYMLHLSRVKGREQLSRVLDLPNGYFCLEETSRGLIYITSNYWCPLGEERGSEHKLLCSATYTPREKKEFACHKIILIEVLKGKRFSSLKNVSIYLIGMLSVLYRLVLFLNNKRRIEMPALRNYQY